ncbi:MAG TPA: flagella basal body P-ring formation protein FlgA [Sphingomonas sp.]|nr:flagella basal body P-ring formation protein FlgA [Sphingomonas sp.]
MARSGPILISLAAIGFAASPALATAGPDGFENLKLLEQRVVGALNADIGTPGGPVTHIDSRLKLKPCPTPATIDPPALGAVAIRCEALGWRIRVPLMKANAQVASGGAAEPAAAVQPVVIKRGDPVELTAASAGFTVSTDAVAQEDGRVGGRIRVKTDKSGPVIMAEVVSVGHVRVAAF